jgi:peptide/nickel transport system ATP-binding protein
MSHTALAPGEPLLEVDNLRTHFHTLAGVVRSVDGVSYTVRAGRTLGVVGESGCGKSVTALSILAAGAHAAGPPHGRRALRGTDLMQLSEREMRQIRGNRISMIFQEPMTSLNPVLTVGRQIAETVQLHQKASRADAMKRAVEMLRVVQIPEPERRVNEYPHQLSGGMRQRVMIALALACNPEVLIADEPTTALDVTIQAQILELIKRLQKELGMGVVMITHDLGVVAESCDRVVVMYAGKKVEEADVIDLFDRPLHPYTRALMASMPAMNTRARGSPRFRAWCRPRTSWAAAAPLRRAAAMRANAAAPRRRSSRSKAATTWWPASRSKNTGMRRTAPRTGRTRRR